MTSHHLTLTRAFIVDTAQMQNTVYDNPMKLFVIIGSELFRIGTDSIHADKYITAYFIALGIVKRNHIGIIVMLQISLIHFENFLIGTKDIGYIAAFLPLPRSDTTYPIGRFSLFYRRHLDVFGKITHSHDFISFIL